MYCSILLQHFYQVFNPVLLVYWSRQWTSNPRVVGSNPPRGKHEFLFFVFFWTKIGIFYALMHKERHKCSLFYFLKIYNNCPFSFSSKMKFSISQLDIVEMKNYSPLQLEPTFGGFPYKMPYFRVVETYLNVVQNPPFFSQMFVWMWEASQWVLSSKVSVDLQLQVFNFESTKKCSFSKENSK